MDVLTCCISIFVSTTARKHWSRVSGPYGGYVKRCTKCREDRSLDSRSEIAIA